MIHGSIFLFLFHSHPKRLNTTQGEESGWVIDCGDPGGDLLTLNTPNTLNTPDTLYTPYGEESGWVVDCCDPGGDLLTVLNRLSYFRFRVKRQRLSRSNDVTLTILLSDK